MNISAGAPYNVAGAISRVTGTTYLTGTLIARRVLKTVNRCQYTRGVLAPVSTYLAPAGDFQRAGTPMINISQTLVLAEVALKVIQDIKVEGYL